MTHRTTQKDLDATAEEMTRLEPFGKWGVFWAYNRPRFERYMERETEHGNLTHDHLESSPRLVSGELERWGIAWIKGAAAILDDRKHDREQWKRDEERRARRKT